MHFSRRGILQLEEGVHCLLDRHFDADKDNVEFH